MIEGHGSEIPLERGRDRPPHVLVTAVAVREHHRPGAITADASVQLVPCAQIEQTLFGLGRESYRWPTKRGWGRLCRLRSAEAIGPLMAEYLPFAAQSA